MVKLNVSLTFRRGSVEHQNIHAAEMASTVRAFEYCFRRHYSPRCSWQTMAIYLLSFEVATTALFTATLLFYLYRGRSGMQR